MPSGLAGDDVSISTPLMFLSGSFFLFVVYFLCLEFSVVVYVQGYFWHARSTVDERGQIK